MLIKCQANSHKPIQQTFILLRVHQYALIEQSVICAYCMAWFIALLPCTHAWRVKQSFCSYICRHENHHFGKSRNLSDLLASLFSWSLQKTAFSPLQIVWYSSRASWTVSMTLPLLSLTHYSNWSTNHSTCHCKHCHVSSSAINLGSKRRHSLVICKQQEVEIESPNTYVYEACWVLL